MKKANDESKSKHENGLIIKNDDHKTMVSPVPDNLWTINSKHIPDYKVKFLTYR